MTTASAVPTSLDRVVGAWGGAVAGGVAALAVFAGALWSIDVGPGGGMGGDVAASAVAFRPAHAPGHALHLALARAATLLPAGAIGFRVRVLSAMLLAVAAAFVTAAAGRLIRAIAGTGGLGASAASCAVGVIAGLSGPALATVASADVYALQAALGAVVLWACVGAVLAASAEPGPSTGRLVLGAFAVGLATINHLPSGLPLAPPLVLAAALVLARGPRAAAAVGGGEPLLAVRVSWIVAGFAVALVGVVALPLREGTLADPAALLSTVLSRSPVAAMEADAPPLGWMPGAAVPDVLVGALGLPALIVAMLAVGMTAMIRTVRPAALTLLGFVLGPAIVRAGVGIDRGPDDVAAYLVVPAMATALAFAVPAGLAVALARGDGGWRRRVGWATLLVLLAAALVRHEAKRIDPAAAEERGRAVGLAADALREPPLPGAVVVIARTPTASLVEHDETVFARRPDLALLSVPRLPDAGYARDRIAVEPGLGALVSAYLGPSDSPATLTAAAQRLASARGLYAEPGRLTSALEPRSQFPRGPLVEILPQALGRTDLVAALATVRREPTRLARRAEALAGSGLGGALAWDLARSALLAARIGTSLSPQPGEAVDARAAFLDEAAELARWAAAIGGPAGPIERLLGALSMVPGPDPERLDKLLGR